LSKNPELIERMLGLLMTFLVSQKSVPLEGVEPSQQLKNLLTQVFLPLTSKVQGLSSSAIHSVLPSKALKRLGLYLTWS
jgi:hypothetical protein